MSNLLNPAPQEEGIKLLSFLEKRLGLPKAMLHRWIREGQCRVNGKRCAPFVKLQPGDLVRVPPFAVNMAPEKTQLSSNAGNTPDPAATLDLPAYLPPADSASPAGSASPASPASPAGSTGSASSANATGPANTAEPGRARDLDRPGKARGANKPGNAADKLLLQQLEDDLLVLCKASGLATQPGSGHTDSVSARLAGLFSGQAFVPAPAHRLDYGSSGLILAGRTLKAQQWLHSLFAEKSRPDLAENPRIEKACPEETGTGCPDALRNNYLVKEYLAWVSGHWPIQGQQLLEDELSVERGPNGQERIIIAPPGKPGKPGKPGGHDANTPGPRKALAMAQLIGFLHFDGSYTPFEAGLAPAGSEGAGGVFASLLRIELITGRKHQIRVQCAGRGHPVLGDAHYGGPVRLPGALCQALCRALPQEFQEVPQELSQKLPRELPRELLGPPRRSESGCPGTQSGPFRQGGPDMSGFSHICPNGFMLHAEALRLPDGRVFRCPPPWPWPFNQFYTPTPIKG